MSIGQRFKTVRLSLGLLQKDFAKKLNLEQSTVSHIELDDPRYPISKKTAAKLISMYKVNMDYLMNGSGEMFLEGLRPEQIVNEPPSMYGEFESLKELLREKDEHNQALKKLAEVTEKYRICEAERAALQRKLDELSTGSKEPEKRKA